MKDSTKGAVLLLTLGVAGVLGATYYLKPKLFERGLRRTSDAKNTNADLTLRFGGDDYLGYWFITSPDLRRQAIQRGIGISFTDDGGTYAERLSKFKDGQYDMIVLPIAEYLYHGGKEKYPGVIVAGISESKGADGIVGFADKFPRGSVNELNDAGLRIVYTAASPSSFLMDLTIRDFGLTSLQESGTWRVEVGGSKEVFEKAKKHDGDVFVLWEPYLSQALDEIPALKYIWGSDKFANYIIDVFVVRREFLEKHEADCLKFFDLYFRTMQAYAANRDRMIDEMAKSQGKKKKVIEAMLPKIDWYDLGENCSRLFGLSSRPDAPATEGVVNSIISCTAVLVHSRRVAEDPLKGNPYLITNSKLLEQLQKRMPTFASVPPGTVVNFAPLDEAGWNSLHQAGVMRVEAITFQTWSSELTLEGKEMVDKFAEQLKVNYPTYRVAVRGHTGSGGDEPANARKSLERAQTVVQRLIAVHGIDANRLHSEGSGSSQPLQRRPAESARSFEYRQSRVEFVLLEGNAI